MLCPTCTTWRDRGTNPEPAPRAANTHVQLASVSHAAMRSGTKTELLDCARAVALHVDLAQRI